MTREPETRDPFIDVLRVAAVAIVVVGHWTVITVYWGGDGTRSVNALSVVPWLRATTWLTQVMPILFFVGGFANATVAARFPGSYPGYLRDRLVRLVAPVAVLFAVWTPIGVSLALFEPPGARVLTHAAFVAAIPLWFLGIYVIVVALAPSLIILHRRFGLVVPVVLVAGAAAVDLVLYGRGVGEVAVLNYAFVWLLAHQLGFWYRDGRLSAPVTARAMALVGLAGLTALTTFGGYPLSMVGVPGQPRWNTDPPSLAIVALTLWLVGLGLLLRPAIARLPAAAVRLVDRARRRLLTVYVWHVTAILLAVVAVYPIGFPQPEPGSAEWWLWRPAWLGALAIALLVLAGAFGRFEIRARPAAVPDPSPARLAGAGLAVFSIASAILGAALTGFSDPFGAGRELLVFGINPAHNALHMILGTGTAWAVLLRGRVGLVVPGAAAAAFVASGWLGASSPSSVSGLGWNQATAVLHLVVGGATLVVAAAGTALQRAANAR